MKDFFRRAPIPFTSSRREQQIPDNVWVKCAHCSELTYQKQFQDALKVCPKCGYHTRMNAREWLDMLLDEGSFEEHDAELQSMDILGFVSPKDNYEAKLEKMIEKTEGNDVIVSGSGCIDGLPFEIAVCNFEFMGGSMGSVFGEKVARATERAAERRVPLITINASGGARMHEGLFSLMQMAKISVALTRLAHARQPHISLLIDPCYGGVSASYASVADIILAEPGAHIGFAGPRVIEQTIRQKLPPDFQTAEFFLAHGMIDAVVPRPEMRATLARLMTLYLGTPYPQHLPELHNMVVGQE
ncbi:MAG: acetyl-CoA carboxylase carboxyltransferase subunit beta [Herpetosiphonaceae bacterium]|nr:acetyl-CoA carboxylase carboxyltransferase subunit beta [Herpetosiphonaceae bacterium]